MKELFKSIKKEEIYDEINLFLNGKKGYNLLTNDSEFSEKLFDLMGEMIKKNKYDICLHQKDNGDKAFKHTKTKIELTFNFRNHYLTKDKFYRLVTKKVYYSKSDYH